MNQSDPLELVDAGTLRRPGPVGRLSRITLAVICLYALWDIVRYAELDIMQPYSSLDNLVLLILAPVCVFNYVVNIGFSKSWGQRPLIGIVAVLLLSAGLGYLWSGSFDSPVFGVPLVLWLAYFYTHLGVSFALSGILATPGCEMRAIPEFLGRIRGIPSEEHHCPVAFITRIDAWEQRGIRHS